MKPEIYASFDSVPQGADVLDIVSSAAAELFFIENPQIDKRTASVPEGNTIDGIWVYYRDRNLAIHMPQEELYLRLRTARNRNLITETEQIAYRNAAIGIAGLSVGSQALAALVQTGGPKRIKLADPDIIEATNLNRIRATITDIGQHKVGIAARDAWLLDPFLDLELWKDGIQNDTLEKFVHEPKIDIFIDEMDDISMKIAARFVCKEARIPVLMATDNGDSVILDVERFDLEPDRPLFHGRVNLPENLHGKLDRTQFIHLANQIIDPNMFVPRQWSSIQEIGKSLSGVPQLASAAMIAGASVSYAVRQIATGAELKSGRYVMGAEAMFA